MTKRMTVAHYQRKKNAVLPTSQNVQIIWYQIN